jgi:hypothetical protein
MRKWLKFTQEEDEKDEKDEKATDQVIKKQNHYS